MNIETKLKNLEKYFKEKKEDVLLNLIIKNYNKSNLYLGFVYNNNIKKYKIVYVPLDIIDKKVDEYVCYQFVLDYIVDYILKIIKENKHIYENNEFRIRNNKDIVNYDIEINLYNEGEYKFKATRTLPKEWVFLFDVVVILFEHSPHLISELCNDLLENLTSKENIIEYNYSYDFDLFNDNLDKIFNKNEIAIFKKNNLDCKYFLEKVNDKYFMVIKDEIIILEYNLHSKIVNFYCSDKELYNYYLYLIIIYIRENRFNKFTKLKLKDGNNYRYYLCYGIKNNCFKVIHVSSEKLISFDELTKENVNLIYCNDLFYNELLLILNDLYSSSLVNKIINNVIS